MNTSKFLARCSVFLLSAAYITSAPAAYADDTHGTTTGSGHSVKADHSKDTADTHGHSTGATAGETAGSKTGASKTTTGTGTEHHTTGAKSDTAGHDPRAGLRMEGAPLGAETAQEIKGVFADAVESALNAGDYGDIVTYLSKNDRDRIGTFNESDSPTIDPIINRISKAWTEKYNGEADFESTEMMNAAFPYTMTGGSEDKRAQVTIPAQGGLPTFTVALINEGTIGDSWKIDAPDTVTKEMLRTQLEKQLTALDSNKASWPTTKTEASRVVAHRILMTLSGKDTAEM